MIRRVKRLLPSSLLGQVMLVLVIGLLVAQSISAVLLYRASEQRREAALVSGLALQIVNALDREELRGRFSDQSNLRAQLRDTASQARRRAGMSGRIGDRSPRVRRRRGVPIQRSAENPVLAGESRVERFEASLRELLVEQGVAAGDIHVTRRRADDDPFVVALVAEEPELRSARWRDRIVLIAAIQREDANGWLTARLPEPRRPAGGPTPLILQTLMIFAVLVLMLYLVLRRITRPLAMLTDRVSDFSRQPDRVVKLEESGPADTRRLIAAHNAMEGRIAALLDEKDVMLGAIGHDLKTPLAALRVRIESVPDGMQRERMAASIEDITRTLDDILSLARIGRNGPAAEAIDLSALAIGVVEEFEDLGQPVTIEDPPRLVASVQETWLKRALRNLIANAVRYGKTAEVVLLETEEAIVLRVDDTGPGIPEDQIANMLEPFTRGEVSRNRATGGAGLGLTLARAIAEQHGGTLVLENRSEGGLRAEIRLPR